MTDASAAMANEFRSVRWPFRLLAALVVCAATVAILGTAWAEVSGQGFAQGGSSTAFLVGLPAIAWLLNLAWSAAVHGRSPSNGHWPFASERVMMAYMLIVFILQ